MSTLPNLADMLLNTELRVEQYAEIFDHLAWFYDVETERQRTVDIGELVETGSFAKPR